MSLLICVLRLTGMLFGPDNAPRPDHWTRLATLISANDTPEGSLEQKTEISHRLDSRLE
jgi:hypothetical protein